MRRHNSPPSPIPRSYKKMIRKSRLDQRVVRSFIPRPANMNYAKLRSQCLNYSWERDALPCAFTRYQPKSQEVIIDTCPIVVVPCVFGWRDNWKYLAQKLADSTTLEVYVVDPRNHGESAQSNNGDYYDMSADIIHFMEGQGISKCHLLGHSLGGRTAMTIAFTRPSLVKSLACLDISPFSEPAPMPQIVRFFSETLKDIVSRLPKDMSLDKAKSKCLRELETHNVERYMREVLTSNLVQNDDGTFRILCNLDYLHARFEIDHFIYPMIDKGYHGPTKFIYIENSEYIKPQDYLKLYKTFPSIEIETMEGESGHHVNLQRPKDVLEMLLPFYRQLQLQQ